MRVAVIGDGPSAIESALNFHLLGANVSIYSSFELDDLDCINLSFPLNCLMKDVISPWGHQLLKNERDDFLNLLEIPFSAETYQRQYLLPILEMIPLHHKKVKVERVQKRFLAPHEAIEGRSRLADLFRIVYKQNPSQQMNDLKKIDPSLFEGLSENIVSHLHSELEGFDDFDIVIETPLFSHPRPAGPSSSQAIGEQSSDREKRFYGIEMLQKQNQIMESSRKIILLGDGEIAGIMLTNLKEWMKDKSHELFLVTSSDAAFENIEDDDLKEKIVAFYQEQKDSFELDRNNFEQKVREWYELEDYEKVKIPKPTEPKRRFTEFLGYNATVVDRLIDRPGLFVTVECPQFRKASNEENLKTLSCDALCVATGHNILKDYRLSDEEPGYYVLGRELEKDARIKTQKCYSAIEDIKADVLSFFSKA